MALRFGNALSSRCGGARASPTSRSRWPRAWAWARAATSTTAPARCATWCQNHALQLLTMVAMEPPSSNDADAIRDEKLKVLRSLKPFTPESVARDVVRGQYRAGNCDGAAAPAYHDEVKVPPTAARDLRRAAHRDPELALGRRALLPAHRQAAGGARRADRRQLPARRRTASSPGVAPAQPAGDQAAARRRPRAAPAGRQGAGHQRHAGAGVPRPRFRQGLRREPSAPTSACCSTRSPGGSTCSCAATSRTGLALGRADPRRLGAPARPAPTPPAPGARGGQRTGGTRRLAWAEEQQWKRAERGRSQTGPYPLGEGRHYSSDEGKHRERHARSHQASIPALPPTEQRVAKRLLLADPRLRHAAGGQLSERAARQQTDGGALLPQRRLRRPGRLQAQAGRQRQRGVPFVHRAVDGTTRPPTSSSR